jgi:hypothetical protein
MQDSGLRLRRARRPDQINSSVYRTPMRSWHLLSSSHRRSWHRVETGISHLSGLAALTSCNSILDSGTPQGAALQLRGGSDMHIRPDIRTSLSKCGALGGLSHTVVIGFIGSLQPSTNLASPRMTRFVSATNHNAAFGNHICALACYVPEPDAARPPQGQNLRYSSSQSLKASVHCATQLPVLSTFHHRPSD